MNKRDWADRFSQDVDNILHEVGANDQGRPSAEYDEMLTLARRLTTTDFSNDSRIRHSLRRKLFSQTEKPLETTIEIPGPWGVFKSFFSPDKHNHIPRFSYPDNSAKLIWRIGAIFSLIIVLIILFISPMRQAITTLWLQPPPLQDLPGLINPLPRQALTLNWQFRGANGISTAPLVTRGQLFVGSNDGFIYALNLETGQELWRLQTSGSITTPPALNTDILFVTNNRGDLYALNPETGRELWQAQVGTGDLTSPVVVANRVYIGSSDHRLYTLDSTTGQEMWQVELEGSISATPLVVQQTVYVGSHDWHLYAFDTTTGQELWRFKTADRIESSPIVVNGMLYVGSNDQNLYALETKTGQKRWQSAPSDDIVAAPTFQADTVYFGSYSGHLYAVAADTGQEKWRFATGKPIQAAPIFAHGLVYVGSGNGNLYGVDPQTGQERARFNAASQIYNELVALERFDPIQNIVEQFVYFVDGKGTLYAVQNMPLFGPAFDRTSDEHRVSSEPPGFQFTPSGWYEADSTIQQSGIIRFAGQILDTEDNPVNNFSIQADSGSLQILSKPSGPNRWQPDTAPGMWEITIPAEDVKTGWWWLTIVHNECLGDETPFTPQCETITRLSESIKLEITATNGVTINADWVCHWDCNNSGSTEE